MEIIAADTFAIRMRCSTIRPTTRRCMDLRMHFARKIKPAQQWRISRAMQPTIPRESMQGKLRRCWHTRTNACTTAELTEAGQIPGDHGLSNKNGSNPGGGEKTSKRNAIRGPGSAHNQ